MTFPLRSLPCQKVNIVMNAQANGSVLSSQDRTISLPCTASEGPTNHNSLDLQNISPKSMITHQVAPPPTKGHNSLIAKSGTKLVRYCNCKFDCRTEKRPPLDMEGCMLLMRCVQISYMSYLKRMVIICSCPCQGDVRSKALNPS